MSDSVSTFQETSSQREANIFTSKEGLTQDLPSVEYNKEETSTISPDSALPTVDGGKDAWLFLAACFVVEALVWGTTSTQRAERTVQ